MFFKTLTLAFAFAASAYAAGTLEINTPYVADISVSGYVLILANLYRGTAKQCVPTLLTFTGGQGECMRRSIYALFFDISP